MRLSIIISTKLAGAIGRLTRTAYENISKAAAGIVHNHLNTRKMAEGYQDTYEKLMKVSGTSCIGK